MKYLPGILSGVVVVLYASGASARGVTPYLPLNLSPAIERQIERVLILAGQPITRRPIPAAVVLEALPAACTQDRELCASVRAYLDGYIREAGVTQLQVTGGAVVGDSDRAIPNGHGRAADSYWQAVAGAFYQPNDYLLLNVGGIGYDGRVVPTGTTLSVGFDFAQLDIGYRDHWLSPLADSSLLISTEAPTMPSVTLSNYAPITPLGFTYELTAAQMSHQENIKYYDTTTSGHPSLAGVQIGFAPAGGYAVTLNRVMQFGGGARGGGGISDFWDAFFQNSNLPDSAQSEEFGNQIASLTATQVIPASIPFAIRIEYAGEDNSYGGSYRLGDTALTLGIDFPLLADRFDLGVEVSEWQNVWYTHHLYPEGMTNEGNVIGHWFGDQRQFGDRVGGWSALVQAGMRTDAGAYWRASYRTLDFVTSIGFQAQPEFPYQQLHEVGLEYSRLWRGFPVSAELVAGRDALGETFGRLMASIDFAMTRAAGRVEPATRSTGKGNGIELFYNVGASNSRVYEILSGPTPDAWTPRSAGFHLGVGVRRQVSKKGDLGVGLEFDDVDDDLLLSVRAADYRYRMTPSIAANAFVGVGRFDRGAPAYGWYFGAGLQWRNILPRWDLGVEGRYYDKLARNRVAPGDPSPVIDRPRIHYDIESVMLYVGRHF